MSLTCPIGIPHPAQDAAASDAAGGSGASRPGVTAAKGRPTPKHAARAEGRRRQPYSAPGNRKAAAQQTREKDRATRQRRLAAMARRGLGAAPRDKGPVRALARDYVDSRYTLSEFYLYGAALLVVVLFIPGLKKSAIFDEIILGLIAVMLVEGWFVGRRILRLAKERYPGESTRGLRSVRGHPRHADAQDADLQAPRVERGARSDPG